MRLIGSLFSLPHELEDFMSANKVNHRRVFADVLSIDAWHDKFSAETAAVDLHADVVFDTARAGGEAESPVRFRLSMKRAELSVIISETEPLGVNKRSVSRSGGVKTETRSFEQTTEVVGAMAGDAKLAVAPSRIFGSLGATAQAEAKRAEKSKWKRTEEVAIIKVTYRFDNFEKCDRWTFEPGIGPILDGRPWLALESPLLQLVDQRNDRTRGIEPSVRLVIRCLREDLDISDIEIKNPTARERISASVSSNRMKAAEAYIRNKLEEAGLEVGDISDKFGKITLADVFANNGRIG
jgi:hypothetical protein